MENQYGSRAFGGADFGGRGFGGRTGAGGPAAALFEVMDQLRSSFEQRPTGPRMARGDVRAAVIALLAEKPMHGYQIIQEIEDRSAGAWKPSAGSVYPTLQLLADEGLITVDEQGERKTYSLTEAGKLVADESAGKSAPWENQGARAGAQFGALPKAGVDLAGAVAQVARTGSPEQIEQAIETLNTARRRLYAILAD